MNKMAQLRCSVNAVFAYQSRLPGFNDATSATSISNQPSATLRACQPQATFRPTKASGFGPLSLSAPPEGAFTLRSLPLAATSQRRWPSVSRMAQHNAGPQEHPGRAFASAAAGDEFPASWKAAVREGVVDVQWLHKNLSSVKVLDGSWYMPAEGRAPKTEFVNERIPGALYFDIDVVKAPSPLPHMLPSAEAFSAAMDVLGIRSSDPVVVYDGKGIFSAPRVWWMFRTFGHTDVTVLNGGLPAWKAAGLSLDKGAAASTEMMAQVEAAVAKAYSAQAGAAQGGYHATLEPSLMWSREQVLDNLAKGAPTQVVDARSAGRFKGTEPEPRPGLRGGHIPKSCNVPFPMILSEGKVKSANDVRSAFQAAGIDTESPAVCSCGTGVTACILALGLHGLGNSRVAIYDGSWSEWGSLPESPIAVD